VVVEIDLAEADKSRVSRVFSGDADMEMGLTEDDSG
jgi:hypothetical protein